MKERVRVFRYDGSNWDHRGGDIVGIANDYLGSSVALSADGNTVAIGAPEANSLAGYVRVLQYDAGGSAWVARGSDIDGGAGDVLGVSVALSADGNTMAIGAPEANAAKGYVRVLQYDAGGSVWVLRGSDIDGGAGDYLGLSVALSADGNTMAIGAPPDAYDVAGYVRVLEYDAGGSTWVQRGSDIVGGAADDEWASRWRCPPTVSPWPSALPKRTPRLGTFALWPSFLTMPARRCRRRLLRCRACRPSRYQVGR